MQRKRANIGRLIVLLSVTVGGFLLFGRGAAPQNDIVVDAATTDEPPVADVPTSSSGRDETDQIPAQPATVFASSSDGCMAFLSEEETYELGRRLSREEMRDRAQHLTVLAEQSRDVDLLRAAAIQTPDDQRAVELALLALDEVPNNPLSLWMAIEACLTTPGNPDCDVDRWLDTLAVVDAGNSFVWASKARRAMERSDEAAALAAMRVMSSVRGQNAYWSDRIRMHLRGLEITMADGAFGDRVVGAIGYVAANGVVFFDWTRLCQKHAKEPGEWRDVCLDVALVHAQTEQEMMSRAAAHKWAGEWLKDAGREDEIKERLGRPNFFADGEYYEALDDLERAMGFALTSPQYYEEYLTRRESQGDLGAARSMVAEIEEAIESGSIVVCE
ncbi:MAG: hypothetical protein AAAFM81_12045 [Pseudomonadota bacterium]